MSHLSCVNQLLLNDLLGGRGWWLVKGALVRGPFFFARLLAVLTARFPLNFPAIEKKLENPINLDNLWLLLLRINYSWNIILRGIT
jgi:hypothetical protein